MVCILTVNYIYPNKQTTRISVVGLIFILDLTHGITLF